LDEDPNEWTPEDFEEDEDYSDDLKKLKRGVSRLIEEFEQLKEDSEEDEESEDTP